MSDEQPAYPELLGRQPSRFDFVCGDCKREGRNAHLFYVGIEYSNMNVCVSEPDENYPGGVRVSDRMQRVPFAIWRCPWGHEYTDGY